jgi:phospholipase D
MKNLLFLVLAIAANAADIEVYFSPHGGAERAIIEEVRKAQKDLLVMAYGFANSEIINALADANASGRRLFVVLDKTNKNNAKLEQLREQGAVIKIDEQTVIAGSYNFSKNAELHNSENLLIIKRKEIAEQYKKHFWERAGE